MSVVADFNIEKDIAYVRLIGEGTEVYRPISVKLLGRKNYVIIDTHVPDGEEWEFLPNETVGISQIATFSGNELYVVVKPSE